MTMAGRFVCVEKVRYDTKAAACAALAKFTASLRRHGHLEGNPRVYRCPACDGWHIGRGARHRSKKGR